MKQKCQYCGDLWYRKSKLCLLCSTKRSAIKDRQALAMRFTGMKYREIAEHFGVSAYRANQMVKHGSRMFFHMVVDGIYLGDSNL